MSPRNSPPAEKFIAYLRVSTDKQGRSGLGLEAQEQAIQQFINYGNRTLLNSFVDVQSGKSVKDRKGLLDAIKECQLRNAKLLIAKLDRLSRDLWFITTLQKLNIKFVCADSPEFNELTIHILAAMAQYERKLISERTKNALSAAKAKGVKLGNPRLSENRNTDTTNARRVKAQRADEFASDIQHVINSAGAQNLSYCEIARQLNAADFKTRRGYEWTPMAVRRVMLRAPKASNLELLLL